MTQKVPQLANGVLAGIPTTINVKGLELNISLAGDPLVTPEALVIRDWGRFQNPGGQSSGEADFIMLSIRGVRITYFFRLFIWKHIMLCKSYLMCINNFQ